MRTSLDMATEVLIALDMAFTEAMAVCTVDMLATEAAMEADLWGEDMDSEAGTVDTGDTQGTAGMAGTAGMELPRAPFRLTSVDLGVFTVVLMGMESESRACIESTESM